MEGWLVTKEEGKRATGGRFTWKLREESDIKEDHKCLASDLMNALCGWSSGPTVWCFIGRWRREVGNRGRQV